MNFPVSLCSTIIVRVAPKETGVHDEGCFKRRLREVDFTVAFGISDAALLKKIAAA
jgi:hypothetical protein